MIFLEEPLPIIFVGIVIEAILGAVFVGTRRRLVLVLMLAVLLVVLGLLGLEWLVVTERERVEATLDGVAAALEANDWERVKSYCTPDAVRTRARVDWASGLVRVLGTGIHNLRVRINEMTSPPTAEARFDGVVVYEGKREYIGRGRYPARFTVRMQRVRGEWLITDHVEYQLRRR